MIELLIETFNDADKTTQLFMMAIFVFGVYSFFKKILTYILCRRRGKNQIDLTYFYFSCNVTVSTKGKNMKAIMYVSLLWVVLGVLISFVAV